MANFRCVLYAAAAVCCKKQIFRQNTFLIRNICCKEYLLQKQIFPINTNFPIKPIFNKKHSLKEYFELFPKYTPALRLEGRDPNRLAAKSP